MLWSLFAGANGYVGTAVCASCHPAENSRQSSTGHAVALRRTADHPLASAFFRAQTKTRSPDFRFQFLSGPTVRISKGPESVDVPIEWEIGRASCRERV